MKTRKRKVSKAARESIRKLFINPDRSQRIGYFRTARYVAILAVALMIGCALTPGDPFECTTVIRNEIEPGCYRNRGAWVKTDYPRDWQVDYGWEQINCTTN
jgi:hypothetical protein